MQHNAEWKNKQIQANGMQREKGCITGKERPRDQQRQRGSEREVATDTFSRSGTQKAMPTRPPVEHEATRGV